MIRALPVCAVLLVPVIGHGGGPEPTATVIRLTVQPAAEPKPALRYQLLPELSEMNPGNPVAGYMKCFMEQGPLFFSKDGAVQREKLLTMPLKELPKNASAYGDAALRQADYAARLQHPDWQTLIPLRRAGIRLLVPDVAAMRNLGAALRVRLRGEIAQRRFDDAITTLKTLFALARHLGDHPTLIGDLVGLAIESSSLQTLDELLGQTNAPNLYWALTTLPTPLVDLRKGVQGERVFLAGELRDIDARTTMTAAALERVVQRAQDLYRQAAEPKEPVRKVRAWLAEHVADPAGVAAARKRLEAFGIDAAASKSFPALQVILLDEKFQCEARRDEAEKLLALPFWHAQAALKKLPPAPARATTLYADLVPAYAKVQMAQARVEQRMALLRSVEALRLYAAGHDGKLPSALTEVSVPLPVDPVTGKAFLYSVKDGTATLRGTPPTGMEKHAPYNVRYEITIAK